MECINCSACEPVCPNEAIYEGEEVYIIKKKACTMCEGEDSKACVDECPVDCIVEDDED